MTCMRAREFINHPQARAHEMYDAIRCLPSIDGAEGAAPPMAGAAGAPNITHDIHHIAFHRIT